MPEIKNPTEANKKILKILGLTDRKINSVTIKFAPDAWPVVTIDMLPEWSTQDEILQLTQDLMSYQNAEAKPCQE